MFSKVLSKSAVSVLGVVFVLSLCIGFSASIAMAQVEECELGEVPTDMCCNNDEYTKEFRLEDCKFKDKGKNPYFILEPGYQLVLETPEGEEPEGEDPRERVVITVLHDKKTITLPREDKKDRKIKTRVVEERESEWEEGDGDEEGEWVTKEISRNYFAICKLTNAVYYFGELSLECDDGFDENDECDGDTSDDGSWEAGIDDAMPGLIMPGTILLGAKYFQEQAEEAMDRGQIEDMGLSWPEDEDEVEVGDEDDFEFTDCIEIIDTNPTEADECDADSEDADIKIYCPGVGLVQDEDLLLVGYGKGGEWEGEQEGDN